MAAGTKLNFEAETENGTKTFTFYNVDPSTEASSVQTLATALLTYGGTGNAGFFTPAITSLKSAKIITTTETNVPLS